MRSLQRILLVGDIVDESISSERERPIFDEDNPSEKEVANIASWLAEGGYEVDVCNNVNSFIDGGHSYKYDIVFPLWRGGASRNRTAILPAYCEARGIPFIGGDTYVQTVCQDKSLSKMLVNTVGMVAPGEIVLQSKDDLANFSPSSRLAAPFVVKPLYSACSIGVNDSSLCCNDRQALERAEELFSAELGPIVCEEFIEGDEVSLCFIEERGTIRERCLGVYRGADGRSPFHNRLFTFEDKLDPSPPWRISVLPDSNIEPVWKLAEDLIRRLGKVDMMRIDAKLNEKGLFLIELTPDIHLALESIFLGSFYEAGVSPVQLLDGLVQCSMRNQISQVTDMV